MTTSHPTRLRQVRDVTRLKQRAFAERTAIPYGYYVQLELGNKGDLTSRIAERISHAVGVDATWLIGIGPDTPIPSRFPGELFTTEFYKTYVAGIGNIDSESDDLNLHSAAADWTAYFANHITRVMRAAEATGRASLCAHVLETAANLAANELRLSRRIAEDEQACAILESLVFGEKRLKELTKDVEEEGEIDPLTYLDAWEIVSPKARLRWARLLLEGSTEEQDRFIRTVSALAQMIQTTLRTMRVRRHLAKMRADRRQKTQTARRKQES
jgi:transcriptional regulator with XRE-family HTH domain